MTVEISGMYTANVNYRDDEHRGLSLPGGDGGVD